jgi:hypothetical protein
MLPMCPGAVAWRHSIPLGARSKESFIFLGALKDIVVFLFGSNAA